MLNSTQVALSVCSAFRRYRALGESFATLHFVVQRRFVDLDHDGISRDPEVLHQSIGDVEHHRPLLLIGAAILGHSERRVLHSEDNEIVLAKALAAIGQA